MNITIRQMDSGSIQHVDQFDRNSIVSAKMVLSLQEGRLTYSIVPVEPYEKKLSVDTEDYTDFIDHPQKAIFFAEVNGKPVGQIKVVPWWNKLAYIEELAVNSEFRGKGVGYALMSKAIEWAKAQNYPGMMLETQDNNVRACLLYERCGFVLGGFDKYVYTNFPENRGEIALYWYLIF